MISIINPIKKYVIHFQTDDVPVTNVSPRNFREREPSARFSRIYASYDSLQQPPASGASGMRVPYNNYYQRMGGSRVALETRKSYPDGQEHVNKVHKYSGNPR